MFLLIDNYDSFTWNIYHYISILGVKVKVVRNDAVQPKDILKKNYAGLILSPGPGHPEDAGNIVSIIKSCNKRTPILGICLGHQAIGHAYGAKIKKLKNVMHGMTDRITKKKNNIIFKDIPKSFIATRYHSLEISEQKLPKNIEILALSANNVIMAIKIKNKPIYGIQFHPESYATEYGKTIFKNFINTCKKNNDVQSNSK